MLDTTQLLGRDPKRALIDIINQENQIQLDPTRVRVSEPVALSGRRTRVTISAEQFQPAGIRRYVGSFPYIYHRLDLAEYFGQIALPISLKLPMTISEAAKMIADIHGIYYKDDDFVHGIIPRGATSFVLEASPNSLRWIGSIPVAIASDYSLQDSIVHTTLNGLLYSYNLTPLASVIRNEVLHGPDYAVMPDHLRNIILHSGDLNGIEGEEFMTELSYAITDHWMNGHVETLPNGDIITADLTIDPMLAMTNLIKSSTPLEIDVEDYEIVEITEADDLHRNTRIRLQARDESHFTGQVDLFYNRIHASQKFPNGVDISTIESLEYVLDEIFDEHGVRLTPEKLTLSQIDEATWKIDFEPDHPLWIGSITITDESAWDWTPQFSNMVRVGEQDLAKFEQTVNYTYGPAIVGDAPSIYNLAEWVVYADGADVYAHVQGEEPSLIFTHSDVVDHVSMSFDQSGNRLIAFSSNSRIFLRWFDPQLAETTVTDLGFGKTPFIAITTWNTVLSSNELLLLYVNDDDELVYRKQSDRYASVVSLSVSEVDEIINVAHSQQDSLVVNYVTLNGELKNIHTQRLGYWTGDALELNYGGVLEHFIIKDAISLIEHTDVLTIEPTGSLEHLSLVDVDIHNETLPTETLTLNMSGSVENFIIDVARAEGDIVDTSTAQGYSISYDQTPTLTIRESLIALEGIEEDGPETVYQTTLLSFTAEIVDEEE